MFGSIEALKEYNETNYIDELVSRYPRKYRENSVYLRGNNLPQIYDSADKLKNTRHIRNTSSSMHKSSKSSEKILSVPQKLF